MFFCRFTQLGLLRLLTNAQVMGAGVMRQGDAWRTHRRWYEDERVEFHKEPETADFDRFFRHYSLRPKPSSKVWADAYLASFARTAGLTIVTFDQALGKMPGCRVCVLPARPAA